MNTMDAILTPYPEVNTDILEVYESFYYDDIDNAITFPDSKAKADAFEFEPLEPRNLENEFQQMEDHNIYDMIAEISSRYPTIGLREIANKLNCVYCNSETMESFVQGQRIGDYEYITQETDYGVFLFGRKQSDDEYSTIQFWLK
jgi:hypothetical protein